MAEKKPLCLYGGRVEELRSGDTVASVSAADVAAELLGTNGGGWINVEDITGLKAAWTASATVVNGLLVADKQTAYARVDPVQPGVVEAGDGVAIYRDTGVIPPPDGGIELEFIYDGGNEFYAGLSGNRCYISTTNGKLTGGLGSSSITVIKGTTDLINGIKYKARLTWDGTTVNLYLNDSIEYTGAQNGAPDPSLSIFIHALNVGSPANFSNSSIISLAILDAAGNPTNYWSADNMYYDQIVNNHAATYGGTPVVTSHPEGDNSLDERGYTNDNGTIIPASQTYPTKDAAGNPLEFAGRNAHSLEIISGSDMSDYVLQYVDDGPLDKYLSGSNIEDGLQNNYAGITETTTVIKFDINGLAVFSTGPSVTSILKAIL